MSESEREKAIIKGQLCKMQSCPLLIVSNI